MARNVIYDREEGFEITTTPVDNQGNNIISWIVKIFDVLTMISNKNCVLLTYLLTQVSFSSSN